jgi:hypothetical protein
MCNSLALSPEEMAIAWGYNVNDKNRPPVVNVNQKERISVLESLGVLMAFVISGSGMKLWLEINQGTNCTFTV